MYRNRPFIKFTLQLVFVEQETRSPSHSRIFVFHIYKSIQTFFVLPKRNVSIRCRWENGSRCSRRRYSSWLAHHGGHHKPQTLEDAWVHYPNSEKLKGVSYSQIVCAKCEYRKSKEKQRMVKVLSAMKRNPLAANHTSQRCSVTDKSILVIVMLIYFFYRYSDARLVNGNHVNIELGRG